MIVSEIDRSDPSTVNHSSRIAAYAVKVAWELGVSKQEADDIEFAALFHNLGTIAMKHVFLMKRGELTEEETRAMRRHPRVAYQLVRRVPLLLGAAEIIRCHQEQPDGRGYPSGLTDDEIPLGSKILLAVDAFDAMINGRAHKRRWTPEDAYRELQRNVPRQFSEQVVETLIRLHRTGRLDEELDANFRNEQARYRYGFQVVQYRARQNLRRALFFLRKALIALFGGNGSTELPEKKETSMEEPRRPRASAPSSAAARTEKGERSSPRVSESEWDNGS
jgi:HD-GYP domain-containing protein (c-di-GMP phosphodiesterase class II)